MKAFIQKFSVASNFISLVLLALALRLLLLYIPSPDITKFFGIWYDQFITIGRLDAFSEIFYNYSPAYLYLIDVMTFFLFSPKEISLKIIPIFFDFFAALAVLKLVEIKYPDGYMRFVGFLIILFTPTVFVESGMWGQCDIVYTSFLLWSLYYILKEKPFYAILFLSIAISFKIQAAFFAPIFVIIFLWRKFPYYLFFVIPVIYLISVIPAWLAGGPLIKLLKLYFNQFDQYSSLSKRAPNLYLFIDSANHFDTKVLIGLIITAIILLAYIILRWRKWNELDNMSIFFDVVLFTLIIPFLLPKMHERYFFSAGLFLIVLALHNKKIIGLAVLMQVSSLLSYIPYFTGWSDLFPKVAAIINCLLIILLINFYRDYRFTHIKNDPISSIMTV